MSSVGSIPFTAYDFFAYLAEGFVMLLALDAAFVGDPSAFLPSVLETLILIAAAYTVGQLVDQVAGGLMETLLFDKTTVGFPSINLFVKRTGGFWLWRLIFNAYWRSVPDQTRSRILEKDSSLALPVLPRTPCYPVPGPAWGAGIGDACVRAPADPAANDGPGRNRCLTATTQEWRPLAADGETLYDHCYGALKAHDADTSGLATLINVYTFCRNMSVALTVGALAVGIGSIFAGSAHTGPDISPGWWVGGALFTAGGLFLRYLKIFRLFHEEVFTTYAALPAETGSSPHAAVSANVT